jgi:hypothetical protein
MARDSRVKSTKKSAGKKSAGKKAAGKKSAESRKAAPKRKSAVTSASPKKSASAKPSKDKNTKTPVSGSRTASGKKKKSDTSKSAASNQITSRNKETKKTTAAKKQNKKPVVSTAKGRVVRSDKKAAREVKSGRSKSLTQHEKDAIAKDKKDKLKEIAARESQEGSQLTPQMIASPTPAMLKPFRDAAKRNQEMLKGKKKSKKKSAFIAKPPKGAKKYAIDLRVHSPVSEGYFSTGGIDPAAAMVRLAKSKGLDIIAITDYNSADFVDIVKNEARETSVTVLPGVDLQCSVGNCSEVSFVALFPEEYSSSELNEILQKLGIPDTAKGRKTFTLREELKKVIEVVESYGGVLIPTRLDTTPHRLIAVKELVEKYGFHAFDLVHPENPEYFKEQWPAGEFTFLSSSNANALGQIGSRGMQLRLASPGFTGLKSLISRRATEKTATK